MTTYSYLIPWPSNTRMRLRVCVYVIVNSLRQHTRVCCLSRLATATNHELVANSITINFPTAPEWLRRPQATSRQIHLLLIIIECLLSKFTSVVALCLITSPKDYVSFAIILHSSLVVHYAMPIYVEWKWTEWKEKNSNRKKSVGTSVNQLIEWADTITSDAETVTHTHTRIHIVYTIGQQVCRIWKWMH